MRRTETVVIGGGQAGLATSRCLTDPGVDHVVLERGRVAERWRSSSWDSLRLLTLNWQSRLPGFRYDGPDPDGYMAAPEVVDYLDRYARSFRAPVEEATSVLAVERAEGGYRVTTDRGAWEAPSVVVATGHCDTPIVPAVARQIDPKIVQVVPTRYLNPRQLPEGGVLVVGASATGLQLAEVAEQVGVAVEVYGRLERGRSLPRADTLARLATALGVTSASLLGLSSAPPSAGPVGGEALAEYTARPEMRRLLRRLRREPARAVSLLAAFVSALQDPPPKRRDGA